ncbi:WhiB family transcriptional regulator [Gephyromycinifex aptenodytis]|uniref:WhiB family transcriptional regulator n=1 Tax=Gephyromycinifex aptenodytis TaxID=2716227 RepID=UPI00144571CF|nr:WhiB family transcriptional regulator [Gephyromycinifex aptenodytis]
MTITSVPMQRRPTDWVEDWTPQAACRNSEPDDLFVQGAAQQQAKKICQRCPVVAECLADALDHHTEFGVWGGMTERERRAMLRRHPHVRSWREMFERALVEEDRSGIGEDLASA